MSEPSQAKECTHTQEPAFFISSLTNPPSLNCTFSFCYLLWKRREGKERERGECGEFKHGWMYVDGKRTLHVTGGLQKAISQNLESHSTGTDEIETSWKHTQR